MPSSASQMQAARRLVAEVIDSFEKLEIVVSVYRSGFRPPVARELAAVLALPIDEVQKCVTALTGHRVLEAQGPWRAALDALVQMYDEDRIEVLNLMTRTALDRVRQEAARVFADAFVLRPKKKGDGDG